MHGVLIIYPSDPELRDISLRPNVDKLLATFCSDYCNRVEVYNIDELYQPGVATRLMCLLQVSFGPSSASKTLYFSATLKDLRFLGDDPTVPTTMITSMCSVFTIRVCHLN